MKSSFFFLIMIFFLSLHSEEKMSINKSGLMFNLDYVDRIISPIDTLEYEISIVNNSGEDIFIVKDYSGNFEKIFVFDCVKKVTRWKGLHLEDIYKNILFKPMLRIRIGESYSFSGMFVFNCKESESSYIEFKISFPFFTHTDELDEVFDLLTNDYHVGVKLSSICIDKIKKVGNEYEVSFITNVFRIRD